MQYRLMLVEHDQQMLEQMAGVISSAPDIELVGRYIKNSDALGQGRFCNPDVILLDIDEGTTDNVLGHYTTTFPHAAIICMGKRWDTELTTGFIQAGANGYIIKPFNYTTLKETIDCYSHSSMEKVSTAISFFSPKGKSGKTTLIANLAIALSRHTGERVGIIDADLQFGDMTVFFDLAPKSTIVEVVRDCEYLSPVMLQSCFTAVDDLVYVLCGTKNPSFIDKVDIPSLEEIIKRSRSMFRYLLIDVPPGFNPTSIAASEMSDFTYLVSMLNGGYEVQHLKRALNIFQSCPDFNERIKTVFTRVEPCTEESAQRMSQAIQYPVEAVIPNAYMVVSKAADNGHMALDLEPDSPLATSINALANKILQYPQNLWRG